MREWIKKYWALIAGGIVAALAGLWWLGRETRPAQDPKRPVTPDVEVPEPRALDTNVAKDYEDGKAKDVADTVASINSRYQ